MRNISELIQNVKASRKKTGVLYCSDSFNQMIQLFILEIPDVQIIDCSDLFNGSLTFSASDFLNKIEDLARCKPSIVFNLEAFIVANSANYAIQLARLLCNREPSVPIFFLFYSKKVFRIFKDQYESKDLNRENTFEF